ncbi:MAG: DsbA family protein [Paracoccaceae bacterium]
MRLTLPALLIAATIMGLPARAEMTDAEREAFRAEVRAYLLENPEVIVEAMDILKAREAEAEAAFDAQVVQDQAALIFDDPASWVGGNLEGDITIVEFVDYRCGYCRKAHDEVAELVKSDGNIRFVIKEFPILGEASLLSSRFAVAVLQLHGPTVYKTVHDKLIALRGEPDQATLTRLATDMGLDADAIVARMGADEVMNVLKANHALADVMQITGTPTFVINDAMVRGYVPLDGMRQIVAEERG